MKVCIIIKSLTLLISVNICTSYYIFIYFVDGRGGQAGIVIQEGDVVHGDVIGVGQPGRNGGRGEDGVVITGGRINRDIIGIGGRGGNAEPEEQGIFILIII